MMDARKKTISIGASSKCQSAQSLAEHSSCFVSDIRKPESGTFTAVGHNLHLPGGTVFAFALAATPSP